MPIPTETAPAAHAVVAAPARSLPARAARALPLLCVLGLVLATLLAASARWFWAGELTVSLAWHLGLACFAIAGLCLGARRFGLALVAVLLGLHHAGPELALCLPRGTEDRLRADEVELRVATCNLLWGNRDLASFPRWLAEHAPDVVMLQEISAARRDTLADLEAYPYLFVSPAPESWKPETWGTAILSRFPFVGTRELAPRFGRPPIEAVVSVGGRHVTLRTTHPNRPGRAWRIVQRNEVLDTLARAPWEGVAVLAGDLNVPSTSPVFKDLVRAGGLSDSRIGFGRQPTFVLKKPARFPLGLRLAIDHVLVRGDVRVLARETSELAGSDHRAVIARLAVRRADSR